MVLYTTTIATHRNDDHDASTGSIGAVGAGTNTAGSALALCFLMILLLL